MDIELQLETKNPKQALAFELWADQQTEQILYGGAKGGAKSFTGAACVFSTALTYDGVHLFIARKELTDLRKFTIPSIHEVFSIWGLRVEDYMNFNGQDNVFNLKNGSKVFLIACKELPSDPLFERFGSMQMTSGWIEEAGEVAEAAKANLWLSIGRWKNEQYGLKKKLLLTSNPKKGFLKREFVDPWKLGILTADKRFVQAFPTDNVYLNPDYVNTLRNEKDNVRRQRLWEGNWDYEEDQDAIVSFDALCDMFSNTIVKDGQNYMVVDVARFGEDTTVTEFWDGLELTGIDQVTKQDTQGTIQRTKDYAAAKKTPYSNIMVDEDGIGGAVVDGMFGVNGFVANSTPLPTATEIRMRQSKIDNPLIPKRNFKNLKTQCAYKLAELINEHKISVQAHEYRDTIIEELTALLKVKDVASDGKLEIKPKSKVKEALGRSPDIGDALIYRAWFELRKEARGEDPHAQANGTAVRAVAMRARENAHLNDVE